MAPHAPLFALASCQAASALHVFSPVCVGLSIDFLGSRCLFFPDVFEANPTTTNTITRKQPTTTNTITRKQPTTTNTITRKQPICAPRQGQSKSAPNVDIKAAIPQGALLRAASVGVGLCSQ